MINLNTILRKRTQQQTQHEVGIGGWVIVPGTYANYIALVVEVISADRATVMLYNDILDEWHTHGKYINQVEAVTGFKAPELAQTLMNIYQTDQAQLWAVAS